MVKGKVSPYNRLLRPLGRVEVYLYPISDLGTEDGIWGSAPRPGRFTPGKDPVLIIQEAGWAPGPVWTDGENLASPPPGFDPQTVQPVASRYTDCGISALYPIS